MFTLIWNVRALAIVVLYTCTADFITGFILAGVSQRGGGTPGFMLACTCVESVKVFEFLSVQYSYCHSLHSLFILVCGFYADYRST